MDNFYIKSILINNFRGYDGEKKYSFEDDSGNPSNIVLLSGPNGYGKTTLMDSIEWCLTGTIKRVYDDYMKRCSQKSERKLENSSKGLIYNVNSKKKYVSVRIECRYKENDVRIEREFNGTNEIDAFEQNSIPDITCKEDIRIDLINIMERIKDNFNFNNVCSYDKNIELYKKGRTDIYSFFESSFSEFSEANKIINNLSDFKEKLNKEKEEIEANIDRMSKNKTDKESILENINKSENIKIREYPKNIIFKSEMYVNDSCFNIIDNDIDVKLEKQIEILTDILYKKIGDNLNDIIYQKKVYIQLLKNKELTQRYLVEKNNIEYINKYNLKELKSNRKQLDLFKDIAIKEIKDSSMGIFITELKSDKSKYKKFIREDEYKIIVDEYDKFKNNEKVIVVLNKQKDLYDSNSPIIKAMRYIVDNQNVYEMYKQESNVCPLCGSETFIESEVGKIAKDFLGNKDEERQSLIKEINEYTNNNEVIIGKIKELVISSIESSVNEINNILKLREELQDIFSLAKELEIDIQKISIEVLTCEKIKLEEKISDLQIKNVRELDIIHLLLELKSPFLLKYIDELKSYNVEYYEKNILLLSQIVDELQKNSSTIQYSINNNEYKTSTLNLIKDKLDITKEIVLYKANNSISCEIKNISKDISNFEKELKVIKEKIIKVQKFITQIKKIKTNSEKNETLRIAEPLSVIYKKITRNTNITEINLKKGTASKKSSLDIIDLDGNNIPFGNVMSAGQVSTLAISMYFAKAILNKNSTFKLYMMDDPIQTMDDLNVISLIDLLRFQFMQPKENRFIDQLFISTCDDDLEKLIFHKMNSFGISIINQNFIRGKY